MELVRLLQLNYALEPTGNDGWALDDFQQLAYLFGASQLTGNINY